MSEILLDVHNLAVYKAPGQPIITNVDFTVREHDVIILQGKSGSGYVRPTLTISMNSGEIPENPLC